MSRLEKNGVLHAFQLLIENAIGKAKHMLKDAQEPVPVSAYDAFDTLARIGKISQLTLEQWNLAIDLRNRIVHEYMNIDMSLVLQLIKVRQYQLMTDFLLSPIID